MGCQSRQTHLFSIWPQHRAAGACLKGPLAHSGSNPRRQRKGSRKTRIPEGFFFFPFLEPRCPLAAQWKPTRPSCRPTQSCSSCLAVTNPHHPSLGREGTGSALTPECHRSWGCSRATAGRAISSSLAALGAPLHTSTASAHPSHPTSIKRPRGAQPDIPHGAAHLGACPRHRRGRDSFDPHSETFSRRKITFLCAHTHTRAPFHL